MNDIIHINFEKMRSVKKDKLGVDSVPGFPIHIQIMNSIMRYDNNRMWSVLMYMECSPVFRGDLAYKTSYNYTYFY